MTRAFMNTQADHTAVSRRLVVAGAMAFGAGLTSRPSLADQISTRAPRTAVSEGGFRYLAEAGSPFSGGVAALAGRTLVRVRLREPAPLEQGLDLVTHHLAGAGRPSSALAGLELRAPSVMSRPEFFQFNKRHVEALRARGFVTGEVVPVARSNMVPLYDPPKTNVLFAFTYVVPSDARAAAGGVDFLLSGRPEQDGSHVIAPNDVSPAGMSRKASFVFEQLRQGVTSLSGRWSDITGVQIYMPKPLPLVMDVIRGTGLTGLGLSYFPGSTPVIGFDGVPYEFEVDVRAVGLERVI
jgi:hypothetical protein